MGDRICTTCGKTMEPIKNGFLFTTLDFEIHTSDLWGCRICKKFQIHGIPKAEPAAFHGSVLTVDLEPDQGEMQDSFQMITDKEIRFTELFYKYMKEWYPEWEMEKIIQ